MSNKKKTETENLKRYLEIEVFPADIEPIIDSKIRTISKTMKVPGFRPGKVPISMVKQTHGVEVESEAINQVINRKYIEELKKKDYKPAGPPNIEPLVDEDSNGKGTDRLIFRAEIEVLPKCYRCLGKASPKIL